MEYSAGNVSNLLWFVEMRETVRLLLDNDAETVRRKVVEENMYQQKSEKRAKREFNCIKKRIDALPDCMAAEMMTADIHMAKLIALISVMATDLLLFEFVYEIYRMKIALDEEMLTEADLSRFFHHKAGQSDVVAGWSDSAVRKLKQTYCKYLQEAGLLQPPVRNVRKVTKPYVDFQLRNMLLKNNMEKYLYALTGEQ